MNLVKRISFAVLGLSAMILSSCKPEENVVEATIAVSPTGVELNYFEQQTEIKVTSSEDWTLEGDYAWVTPSTVAGKNGDAVVFSVNANTTGKTRTASFTFKVTGAEAKAVIKQTAGEVEMNLGLAAVSSGDEDVTLTLNVASKDIAFFNKWGVLYSLTDSKDDGKDFVIEGAPAEGDKEVKVTGLETNKKYFFWGFVEDLSGNRYYTDRPVEKSTGNLIEIPATYSAGAFSVYAQLDYEHVDAVELGICWSETAEPSVDDNVAKIDNPESGEIMIASITSGKRLAPETKYYVRVYTKDSAGKVLYTPAEEITTLANPILNWVNTDTKAENKFNSLCEYGPSWDGESDYNQYVVDNGSDTQIEFRNIWNEAFLSYTDYHYSYSSLMFREIEGKMYMYHQIYREGSPNEGQPKEANFIGGLVYEMEFDAEGNMKFKFAGLQHMSTNNWVCDRQDVVKNEMYHLYNTKATNKENILKIQKFYEDHTFFVDYGPETKFNGASYRELRFYAADDFSLAFNYHQRIIGFKNYDFKTYATDDSGEGGDIGGGDEGTSVPAPAAYANMKQNSVAIAWADNSAVNGLSAITMETLFRWDGFNPDEGIDTMFGIEGSWIVRCFNNFSWIPADGWFVGAPGGEFCFAPFERDADKTVTNWKGMTQDTWHHLALTYDSDNGSVVVYIDGQVVSSGTYPLGPVNLFNSELADPTFYLGKSYNDRRWFNGDLSEVRIWSRALSAEEINAEGHFYSVDPASADRLLAYWKLGNGQGTHVEDYSGNGHHGTAAKDMAYVEGTPTPDPEPSSNLYLYVNAGGQEQKFEVPVKGEGWHYAVSEGTLAGMKYRLSYDASTGYPAYVPAAGGGYAEITDASGMVEMPVVNEQATHCMVSFSKNENICVVKDVFYKEHITLVGDAIVTSYNEDWNAWNAYTIDKNFMAPANQKKEPHIVSLTATFKTKAGGEGFKLITDAGWDNCIMSEVSGANPVGTWCKGAFKYANDWKWNPQVEGDYKVYLNLNTMELMMVKVGGTTPEPEPEPDPDQDGIAAPAKFADMRHNSVAVEWSDTTAVKNLSAITMETLFKWDSFNPDEGIDTMFGVEGSWLVRCMNNFHWIPEDGWFLGSPNGSLCFAPFERSSGVVSDWKGMTQNVWHHLAITYDSNNGNVAIYIDGEVTASGTYNLGTVNLYDSNLTDPVFHIGKSYNERRWFNGDMAEVRLWNRALSADEINADGHFYSVPANSNGLLAYWKLDGTGTHVEDYSGNGHHGTAESAF